MKVSCTCFKELYNETTKVTEPNVEEYFCRFNVRRSILNKTQMLCSMVKKNDGLNILKLRLSFNNNKNDRQVYPIGDRQRKYP